MWNDIVHTCISSFFRWSLYVYFTIQPGLVTSEKKLFDLWQLFHFFSNLEQFLAMSRFTLFKTFAFAAFKSNATKTLDNTLERFRKWESIGFSNQISKNSFPVIRNMAKSKQNSRNEQNRTGLCNRNRITDPWLSQSVFKPYLLSLSLFAGWDLNG